MTLFGGKMKPRIIERIENIEENLEATIQKIVKDHISIATPPVEGVLVGTIIAFSGDMDGVHPINPVTRKADTSYVLCNGESYFSKNIGGMIQTPDLRDRFIMGSGKVFLAGQTGGTTKSVFNVEITPTTLSLNQIPSHTHRYMKGSTENSNSGVVGIKTLYLSGVDAVSPKYHTSTAAGGGKPHTHQGKLTFSAYDKLPPYRVLHYLMKI